MKKLLGACLFTLLSILAIPTSASAQNYYVWKDASDTNTCLESSTARNPAAPEVIWQVAPDIPDYNRKWPKATVSAGMACLTAAVGAGGTHRLYIMDGVYNTGMSGIPSGSPGNVHWIAAYEAQRVYIKPPDGTVCIDLTGGQSYLHFRNITCDMSNQTGATPAIKVDGGAHDIEFFNVKVKNNVSGTGNCVTLANATAIWIHFFSEFQDCGGNGIEIQRSGNIIDRSWIHGNKGWGIYATGNANIDLNTISRNEVYSNGISGGFPTTGGIYIGSNLGGDNNLVYENIVDHNGTDGIKVEGTLTLLYNNTMAKNGNYGLLIAAGAVNTNATNNLAPTAGSCGNTTSGFVDNGTASTLATNLQTDPAFFDCAGRNFAFAPSSPAVDTGTTLFNPYERDIDYNFRPIGGAFDVGAHEVPSGCPAGVCNVAGGADLQLALNQARCGETIKLANGAEWASGPYVLPRKYDCDGVHYTTLTRSGTLPAVPNVMEMCLQIGPDFAAEMAKRDQCKNDLIALLETNAPTITGLGDASITGGYGVVLATTFYADYWEITGVHIRSTASGPASSQFALFVAGFDGAANIGTADAPVRIDQLPEHLVFDRVSVHPAIESTMYVSNRHGLLVNANDVTLKNSMVYNIHDAICCNTDAQAYMSWASDGPHLIENNFLEAAGENVLFGGASPYFWGQVPSNIVQRLNYMTKNWGWFENASRWGYTTLYAPFYKPTVKNVTECKNCRNILYDRNVFEASTDTNQSGHLMLHQGVSDGRDCWWCEVSDIEVVGNVFRHAMAGISYAAKSLSTSGTTMSHNVNYHDNLFYGMSNKYSEILGPTQYEGAAYAFTVYSNSLLKGSVFDPITGNRSDDSTPPLQGFKFNHNTYDAEGWMTIGDFGITGRMLTNTESYITGWEIKDNLMINFGSGDTGIISMAAFGSACGNDHTCQFNWITNHDPAVSTNYSLTHNASFNYFVNLFNFPGAGVTNWFESGANNAAARSLYNAIFENQPARDYHVKASSLYHAGNARQSTDGKDLGADLSYLPLGGTVPPVTPTPTDHKLHGRFGR